MALYSNAIQKPLGKNTSNMASYDILCLHTMVGYLASTDAYFRTVGTFSHFGIGGIWGSDVSAKLDGVVYQWGDTAKRSAANLNGNDVVISVETADNAPQSASDILPWTPKQQDAIIALMVWAHKTHGIPLSLIPDTKPGRKGIAYHRQGIDPWRVSGGVLWSSSTGKVCPGDRRIAQVPGLIERANSIITEELDVLAFYASKAEYEAAVKANTLAAIRDFFNATDIKVPVGQTNNDGFITTLTSLSQGEVNRDSLNMAKLTAALSALNTQVSGVTDAVSAAVIAVLSTFHPENIAISDEELAQLGKTIGVQVSDLIAAREYRVVPV